VCVGQIANPGCDAGQGLVGVAQGRSNQDHASVVQVFQWRFAHSVSEAFGERGSGHGHIPGSLGTVRSAMTLAHAAARQGQGDRHAARGMARPSSRRAFAWLVGWQVWRVTSWPDSPSRH
jgi:hypothetical protein